MKHTLLTALIGLCMVAIGRADDANKPEENAGPTGSEATVRPIPTLTGGMAFDAAFSPGTQTYTPTVNPIVLMPLGNRLLIETEFNFNSDLTRNSGVWDPRRLNREIEYMQLDYLVHPNLTLVVGRILTPFGIYIERYHPEWIRDLQVAPIIFGISHSQSMGAELRGAVHLTSKVDLTYTGFYAVNSTTKYFDGDRAAGGRTSLFFPKGGVEVGLSYNRRLGDQRFNLYGIDGTWNIKSIPLDLRSEAFKTGMLGNGYWIEGAYRLNQLSHNSFMRKSQVVLRGEQYFAPNQDAMDAMAMAGMMMGDNFLPDRDTSRGFAGWNYYVSDAVKLSFAFGRSFAPGQNQNIYSAGVTYRFATGGSQSYLRQNAPDRAVEQVNQALLTAQSLDQPSPLPTDLLQSVQTAIKDAPRSPAAAVSQAPATIISPPSQAAALPDPPPPPGVVPQPAPTNVIPNPQPLVARMPPKQAAAGNADDYESLGRVRTSEGNFQEALNLLNRAIELNPRLASSYNARGYVYLRLLHFDPATADFSEAIRLNPAYANAYHNRSVSRRRKGDRTGAAQDDRRAAELGVNTKRPSNPVTANR